MPTPIPQGGYHDWTRPPAEPIRYAPLDRWRGWRDGRAGVPAVVGMRLPEAKELLSGNGYPVTVEDATGAGRQVLEPLNWVVTAQLPEAGAAAPSGTQVVLKVRKPTDLTSSVPPPSPVSSRR